MRKFLFRNGKELRGHTEINLGAQHYVHLDAFFIQASLEHIWDWRTPGG